VGRTITLTLLRCGKDETVDLTLDGQPVAGIEELKAALQQYEPGQKVALTVLRDRQKVELSVSLGEPPLSAPWVSGAWQPG
jgi:S1-C subfamily serine protease